METTLKRTSEGGRVKVDGLLGSFRKGRYAEAKKPRR